jgi:outer membrane protein TolC
VLLALVVSALSAQEAAPNFGIDERLTIEGLVGAVLEQNPRLRAAQAAAEAAAYRIDPAGSLDDPMLSYVAAPRASDQNFEFSQQLPWPGTLSAREAAAAGEAAAARWSVDSDRLMLAAAAKSAYAEWYFVARALDIHHAVQDLVDELIATAEARYAAGRASRQDVLQAEVERADLKNHRLQLTRQQTAVLARINALLNRAPDAPLPSAAPIRIQPPPLETEALERLSVDRHPELRRLDAQIETAGSRVTLARKAFYPDFQLRAGYNTLRDESDKRPTVGVSINVPLDRGKRQAELDRTRAEMRRTEWTLTERRAQLRADLARSRAEVVESISSVELYEREFMPLAAEYLDAALADYRSGAGAFLNVVTAERRRLTTELALERARADYLRRLAELELWTGDAFDAAANTR